MRPPADKKCLYCGVELGIGKLSYCDTKCGRKFSRYKLPKDQTEDVMSYEADLRKRDRARKDITYTSERLELDAKRSAEAYLTVGVRYMKISEKKQQEKNNNRRYFKMLLSSSINANRAIAGMEDRTKTLEPEYFIIKNGVVYAEKNNKPKGAKGLSTGGLQWSP